MYYTTQGWGHVIKRLRDLTDLVVVCKKKRFWIPRIRIIDKYDFIDKVTRKKLIFGWWYPLDAKKYSPELFAHRFLDPKRIREFLLGQWTLYPSEIRRLGACYDTTFFVEGSVLSKTAKRDLAFKAEDMQDIDTDLALSDTKAVQELIESEDGKDF
jgi:hypothetical protein